MIKQLLKSAACIAVAVLTSSTMSWAQEFKLTLADQNSPNSLYERNAIQPWAKRVEEATKGRVKIQIYPSQTLTKGVDTWKAVKSGVTDIGWCFHGYWADMTPNTDVLTMPFLSYPNAEKGGEVAWKMYEKFPVIQREFADVKVLMLWVSVSHALMTKKKLVKTLEDLKGLKIRVSGGPPTDQMRALGGVPVLLPQPDTYDAADKGVIDGMAASWEAVHGFRFYEVASNYTIAPMSAVFFSMSMNKQTWNRLPKDIQDAIMSVSGVNGSREMGKGAYDSAMPIVEKAIADGKYAYNRYVLPPEELERWRKLGGEPVWEEWIKKMEAKGHKQARELLVAVQELIKN